MSGLAWLHDGEMPGGQPSLDQRLPGIADPPRAFTARRARWQRCIRQARTRNAMALILATAGVFD